MIEHFLSHEQNKKMEGPITESECLKAVQSMKSNKSPGLDGLPKEFYSVMWEKIGPDLVGVLNIAFMRGTLPRSMTQGLITLLYKEKGDAALLKNWRPVTLMNVDYKILTKVLTNRLKPHMDKLVSIEQACGVPSRTIHDQL